MHMFFAYVSGKIFWAKDGKTATDLQLQWCSAQFIHPKWPISFTLCAYFIKKCFYFLYSEVFSLWIGEKKKKTTTIFECSNVWIKLNCCLPVPSYAGLSSWCFKMFLSVYWWKGSGQNGFMSNLLWQFLHALLCLWNLQPIIKYKTDPLQSNCMKDYFNWD